MGRLADVRRALDGEESPRDRTEELIEAITALVDKLEGPPDMTRVAQAITELAAAQGERFERQAKASTRATTALVKTLSERTDGSTAAVAAQLAELAQGTPRLVEALTGALEGIEAPISTPQRVRYDVQRDRRGLILNVTAVPIDL